MIVWRVSLCGRDVPLRRPAGLAAEQCPSDTAEHAHHKWKMRRVASTRYLLIRIAVSAPMLGIRLPDAGMFRTVLHERPSEDMRCASIW